MHNHHPIHLRLKTSIFLTSFLLITLTGCLSLAEDITPPPGINPPLNPNTVDPTTNVEDVSLIIPQETPDPNHGAELYILNCAPCHGDRGMGDGPDAAILEGAVPDVGSVSVAQYASPIQWFTIITHGNMQALMPPFSNLSDQERWDIVAYLYTLSASPEIVEQGESLFMENCAQCHGEDRSQGVVDLSDPVFLSQSSADNLIQTIAQGHEIMPAFEGLSSDQFWALSAYLRLATYIPFQVQIANQNTSQEVAVSDSSSETSDLEEGEELLSQEQENNPELINVDVTILNQSEEPLPSSMAIVLRGYDDMTESYSKTLTLQGGSVVQSAEVPRIVGRMYFATIDYENATYGSNVISLEEGINQPLTLEISYYPPTVDLTVLSVDRIHVFIDFIDDQNLEIVQLYIFSNPSNNVLVPTKTEETVVNFVIPSNASNLYVEENMRLAYRKTNTGFGISTIYPDIDPYQAVFSYQIPYIEKEMDLVIPIAMDANAMIVLAPADGFKVKSQQLEEVGIREFQGVSYNMFTGAGIGTGDSLFLNLSGRPKQKTNLLTSDDNSNTNLFIGLAGLGLALIVVGIILRKRDKSEFDESYDQDDGVDIEKESPEDLMDAIIALDDQYRSGILPEKAYHQRRDLLKDRLRAVVDSE